MCIYFIIHYEFLLKEIPKQRCAKFFCTKLLLFQLNKQHFHGNGLCLSLVDVLKFIANTVDYCSER